MRSTVVLFAFLLASCARPNLRPEWIRTAGSAYGCPPEALARADTAPGFRGRDPRLFPVGTGVCELVVRTGIPTQVLPDRQALAEVKETWLFEVPADAAGSRHVVSVTLEGPTRREMVITALQDVVTPAAAQQAPGGGRRRRG